MRLPNYLSSENLQYIVSNTNLFVQEVVDAAQAKIDTNQLEQIHPRWDSKVSDLINVVDTSEEINIGETKKNIANKSMQHTVLMITGFMILLFAIISYQSLIILVFASLLGVVFLYFGFIGYKERNDIYKYIIKKGDSSVNVFINNTKKQTSKISFVEYEYYHSGGRYSTYVSILKIYFEDKSSKEIVRGIEDHFIFSLANHLALYTDTELKFILPTASFFERLKDDNQ